MIAVSLDPDLAADVAARMLEEPRHAEEPEDEILSDLARVRRKALAKIANGKRNGV